MRSTVALVVLVLLLLVPPAARPQSTDLDSYALVGALRVKLGKAGSVGAGEVGSNGTVAIGGGTTVAANVVADRLRMRPGALVQGAAYVNQWNGAGAVLGGFGGPVTLTLPPVPTVNVGTTDVDVPDLNVVTLGGGSYREITVGAGASLTLSGAVTEADSFVVRGHRRTRPTEVFCTASGGCTVRVRSRLRVAGDVGTSGASLTFEFAGTRTVSMGLPGAVVRASVVAPLARVRLRSLGTDPGDFTGRFVGAQIAVAKAATVRGVGFVPSCGDGLVSPPGEQCDPPADSACPGLCQPDCQCGFPPGTPPFLHAVGPSVLNNATGFGVQLFGANLQPGAQVELSDKATAQVIQVLPTTFVSSTEITALVPAGMVVPAGIQRELVAKVINPDSLRSTAPTIGHCANDLPDSPIACTEDADCPAGAGACVTGDQRLTMFNDLAFLNPSSVAVVPPPHGLCDDGTRCQSAASCAGIGSGACSPKLYATPQQLDEVWVYHTGTGQFVDQEPIAPGIQGIAVGDNPFHVEILTAGGSPRAWVVNRFDDALSILDPETDAEVARITGAALGAPGRLRMGTEVEFNRAGTRAYLSNQNLDEVQVLDIAGASRDAPVLVGTIDVGVNPRGMATNTADTRLYVANVQSADVSVVDIASGSATENQVLGTIAARATDDIVGGRADGWEAFVISGRAPRGIVFSDARQALFVTSIGPQTGPRAGVGQVGGAIINPTVTVIDAASETIVAHVSLNGRDPDRPKCTDPELMALDDARGRLYVTCQGSGTIDVLDTAALAAGSPAELHLVSLPLPTDVSVPTLAIPAVVGGFGAKVCAAFTSNPGTPCATDAQCSGCPTLREGLPVECCAANNPIGLHNGPRGLTLAPDRDTLWVLNQFTTSVSTLDVSPADPALITVSGTTSFPGAFGTDTEQRDRRLGQIEFFTDVKGTNTSCATCHIDDHQDGVFFEADVAGPRLRRVLSVRGTRDFPPLLQDQLLPDLVAFTDIVVHIERGGPVCTPCTELGGSFFCFPAPEGTCFQTSNGENQQNALYAKAITFFPNPNLEPDGAFSTTVPLPGGGTGDAVRGEEVFDALACATCHPAPLFTLDQFRIFTVSVFSSVQARRMRETGTPVLIPLRAKCQDANRPTGVDGSTGFGVPTLRGIWDTFPLLVSGAAGLGAVGPEPPFSPGCTPGSSGCCTQLASPLNPGGTPVPAQHLAVTTKDAMRAVLTPPLAVPGTGHGAALALPASDLDALIAYLRSL